MANDIDFLPVKIDISVEDFLLQSDAFYTVCFITENDFAPRNIEVTKLSDLLDLGFLRISNAYNFVFSVFSQRKMNKVIVRSKRTNETYKEAFEAFDNNSYYFVVTESKDVSDVLDLNDYLINSKENKLQFFSSTEDLSSLMTGREKLVYYFQDEFYPTPPPYSDGSGLWQWYDNSYVQWDDFSNTQLEVYDMDLETAQNQPSNYPEGAWIGYCGFYFPSRVQWLHKYLAKVKPTNRTTIPELSTASALMYGKDKATTGSGSTLSSVRIEQKVMHDWLVWAIQKNLWNILYTQEKVPQTSSGSLIMENSLKEVLNVAVSENHFSSYRVTEVKQDRRTNKLSMKFSATLVHTILGVDKVEGTIYN